MNHQHKQRNQSLKYNSIIIILLLVVVNLSAQQPSKLVNPFIGTGAHGHTFPGATYPFGMMQLSPDTRLSGWDGCSGYHYSDSLIYGFSHTHLSGTGVPDYCDILIIPTVGLSSSREPVNSEYRSSFSHKKESASPGYYAVHLDKYDIMAQLTVGRRAGMHRYFFDNTNSSKYLENKNSKVMQVVIDLSHRDELLSSEIKVAGDNAIEGHRHSKSWATDQQLYYYIEFSRPLLTTKIFHNQKAVLTFKSDSQNRTLLLRIGISSVSPENAKMNLQSEIPDWDFDKLRTHTESAWNQYLSKIEIENNSDKELKTIFYTALYHTAIAPNLYSDVNGEYRGMDRAIHKADGYDQYSVFSLWDTYRTLHPLLTLIDRGRTLDFIKSFLAIFQQNGKLPIWELSGNETDCMIGYHAVPVIADAYTKGIDQFDIDSALYAMITSSNRNEYGADVYRKDCFIPAEKEHESVSKTLEYAYDDWCIAQIAKILKDRCNKKVCKRYCTIYNEYIKRSQYYKNLFNKANGFFSPKLNGSWISPFDPREVNVHYTEATPWQYNFYVPHDIETHIEMLGGDCLYAAKLDSLFSAPEKTTGRTQVDITGLIGQYAHGNEPSHHTAYLYSYAGKPWKTQYMVRKIIRDLYSPYPDGLCGNDDCGQLSAWLVMSSLGFYPVTPADTNFILGSPLFKRVTINLENSKHFIINAPDNNNKNIYIKGLKLNGSNYSKSYLSYRNLLSGGELEIEMDSIPNKDFGTELQNRPRSKVSDNLITINPIIITDNKIFKDSAIVTIESPSKDGKYSMFYSLDTIAKNFREYHKPLIIKESSTIYTYSINSANGKKSAVISGSLHKIKKDWKIVLHSKYNPQYNAGGTTGLIDGIRGAKNYKLGGWQGYQSTDFEAVVDLGQIQKIKRAGAGFLQDIRSWIWLPKYVEIWVSQDGKKYSKAGIITHSIADNKTECIVEDLTKSFESISARYIKIFAKNYGLIPAWHPGANSPAFIFIDEIIIEHY